MSSSTRTSVRASPPRNRFRAADPLTTPARAGRAFFKDLRKSGRSVREDWPRYAEYARTHASIYGAVTGVRRGDDSGEDADTSGSRWGADSPLPGQSQSGHGHAGESSSGAYGEKLEGWKREDGAFDTNERLSADHEAGLVLGEPRST